LRIPEFSGKERRSEGKEESRRVRIRRRSKEKRPKQILVGRLQAAGIADGNLRKGRTQRDQIISRAKLLVKKKIERKKVGLSAERRERKGENVKH